MKILGIDPSGNYHEGKGTTGYCVMEYGEIIELGEIKAVDFNSAEAYWLAHLDLLAGARPNVVVMEGYKLYHHKKMKADTQANSILETPQLIGVIRLDCHRRNRPLHIQYASEVKTRWNEKVLVAKGYLTEKNNRYYFKGSQTSTHKRDSMKHTLHFWRYKR